jgi:hypothetical protein
MHATPEGQPRSWPHRPTAEVRRSGAWPALLGVLGLLGAVVVGLVAHCLVRAWFAAHPVIEPVVSGEVSVRLPAWLILLSLGFYLLLLLLPVASVVSFVLAVAVSRRGVRLRRMRGSAPVNLRESPNPRVKPRSGSWNSPGLRKLRPPRTTGSARRLWRPTLPVVWGGRPNGRGRPTWR